MPMRTTLSVLAEPNRFDIVELLRSGPLSVNEIASRLGLRQPQASKHLSVLASAGVVVKQSQAQLRIYSLEGEAFKELDAWIGRYRRLWEERIDTFGDYAREMERGRSKIGGRRAEGYDEEAGQ